MMDVYAFGRELLRTKDLDPVYVLLYEARLGWLQPNLLERWLLAYWCFYHVGTASWITEGITEGDVGYWVRLEQAAASKDYPRSSERRHFRGENARKSVEWLKARGLQALFLPLSQPREGRPLPVSQVVSYVQTWVGFGPWIAFKVADMLERLGITKVEFDLETVMYDSPAKAADLMYETYFNSAGKGFVDLPKNVGKWAVERILSELGKEKAPPRYERPINVQEVETILCKWGSYRKGHYKLGEDIEHCKRGLLRFSKCKLSQRLYAGGRKGGLW